MTIETVVTVRVERPYVLDVTFADGTRQRVDVEPLLYGEVFEPLRDPARFAEVTVDDELGTVVWPNGADLSPEFLYTGGQADPAKESPGGRQGQTLRYVVVYEQTPNNWSASVPDLPGCVATGKTREEVARLIQERIVYYIEALREQNEPVPQPGTWAETVEVALPSMP